MAHDLRVTSNVFLIVKGGEEYRAYSMQVLSHDGYNVLKAKYSSGENFADMEGGGHYISEGTHYIGSPEQPIPHGDPGQGYTYIWPDELPAGFYRG